MDGPRRSCAALPRPACPPSTRAERERRDRSPAGRGRRLAGSQSCCSLPHDFWASTASASAALPRPAVSDPSQGSPGPLPAASSLPAGASLLLPAVSGPIGAWGQGSTPLTVATLSTVSSREAATRDAPPRGRVRDMLGRWLGARWVVDDDAPRGHFSSPSAENSELSSGVEVVDGGAVGAAADTSLPCNVNQIPTSRAPPSIPT